MTRRLRAPANSRAEPSLSRPLLAFEFGSRSEPEFVASPVRQNFFGAVSQDWLVRFLEHRIGDNRIIRLIQKWLKAGHTRRWGRDGR